MVDRAQEQLLGYLLGALDESERETLESRLRDDPQLRRQLASARERLQPISAGKPEFAPPRGLAARTCHYVAAYAARCAPSGCQTSEEPRPATAGKSLPSAPEVGGSYTPWLDVAVAAGIAAAAALLIFPAIQNSRFNSRLAACQDHLRQLGLALTQYSENHQGYLPPVYDRGKGAGAGIFGPVLVTYQYVDDPQLFICPSSPLARGDPCHVPTLDELMAASGRELDRLRRSMGGSYASGLGFIEDGRYHSPRNFRSPCVPLLSDVPSSTLPDLQSINHEGDGQNVLYQDCHAGYLKSPQPDGQADHLFLNDEKKVAAGKHRHDAVMASSTAVPNLPEPIAVGSQW